MARGAWWTEKNRKAKRKAAKLGVLRAVDFAEQEVTTSIGQRGGITATNPTPIRVWIPARTSSATEVTSMVNLTSAHLAELDAHGNWVRI